MDFNKIYKPYGKENSSRDIYNTIGVAWPDISYKHPKVKYY